MDDINIMDEANTVTIIDPITPTIVVDAVINFEAEDASPKVINPETLLTADTHLQMPDTMPVQILHDKDEKLTVFFNETYVIFLPECFFIYSWYSYRYYRKIIKNLTSKGIKVINIAKIVKYQESTHGSSLLFDDNKYPDPNILYIHLFNGLYYNDAIFNKRKIEKERDRKSYKKSKRG